MTRPLVLTAVLIGTTGLAVGQNIPLPVQSAIFKRAAGVTAVGPKMTDEKALDAAGLKADDPGPLLAYVRQRTLSPTDLGRIRGVIRRFAEEDFDERLKAATEAERFGPAAVGPLKAAQADPDPEVAYRATETLKRMEKVPHAAVALAAVRALGRLKPPEAAGVLIRFLPMADDDAVAEEIRGALVRLAVRDGNPEPALVAGLTDPNPVCRAAAGVALIEGGPPEKRVRVPAALPAVWAAAKAESDPDTKFQLVYALLTVAREKDAVAAVIDLLPELPRGRLWQAEDFLLQLAGPNAPKAVLGKSRDSLAQARTAWKAWWDGAAAGTDLAAFRYQPRVAGRTLLVLSDVRFGRNGTVLEIGPDLKERWKITGLAMPMDGQMLADGAVAVAEQNSTGVTIRDTGGRLLATRTPAGLNRGVRGPVHQVQVLPNGNLLLVGRNAVVELKKDSDEVVMQYTRLQYDILAGRRLPDGTTAVLLQNPTPPSNSNCVFLEAKGKEGKELPDRKLKTGPPNYQAALDAPAPGRLLVTERDKVVEYDLSTGKAVWTHATGGRPRSVQRLPNGNTLVVVDGELTQAEPGRLVEVTPSGDEVWAYQLDAKYAGLVLTRAYRR